MFTKKVVPFFHCATKILGFLHFEIGILGFHSVWNWDFGKVTMKMGFGYSWGEIGILETIV